MNDSTLVDVLRGHALRRKDQVAVFYLSDEGVVDRTVTFSELDRQARSIAAWLQHRELVGERVILIYAHSRDFLPAFLGCLYAGAVAVPTHVPHRLRFLDRLQTIRADSSARAVLTATETLEACRQAFPARAGGMAWLATDSLGDGSAKWVPPQVDLPTLAFLQYTSGSTAAPRGVMVRHSNLMHNLRLTHRVWASDSESVVLSWLPFFHDMGLIGAMLGSLFVGCSLYQMSPAVFMQRPFRWLQAVSRYRATHSGGPNFAYDHCVRHVGLEERQSLDLSSWRVAWNGAEPLQNSTLERFHAAFAPCGFRLEAHAPCYGLAEATLMVSGSPCGERVVARLVDREALGRHRLAPAAGQPDLRAGSLVSSGRIGADLKVLLVDPESRQVCAPEEVGEIWVAGPSVAGGYWNQPEKTAETFGAHTTDGAGPFLRTGDLGFLWHGELFVVGRVKELIIIRGRNYYPTDLEQTAWTSHPALLQHGGAAFGVSGPDGTERVVIVHEVRREAVRGIEPTEVFAAIRRAVSEQHEVSLGAVVLLKPGQLPRTSSGKTRRRACATGFQRGELQCLAQWQETPAEAPDASASDIDLEAALRQTPAGHRQGVLTERVQRIVQDILSTPGLPDPETAFLELGLDSLQTVAFHQRLEAGLRRPLPATLTQQHPTITAVVAFVLSEVMHPDESAGSPSPTATQTNALPGTRGPVREKHLPRKLSGVEALIWGGGRITVNAVGVMRVRGAFTGAALTEAIAAVQAKHPLLAVRIRLDEDDYPWLATDTRSLPLRIAPRPSENHWEYEVARELETPFDGLNGPLARFVCLHSTEVSEVIFCCHHALADGISMKYAMQDLLAALGSPGTNFDPLPERPSLESWIPAELAEVATHIPFPSLPKCAPEEFGVPFGRRANLRVLSWLLPAEDTSALQARARGEKTSIQGALCAALLLAHNDVFGHQRTRTVSCPISLRGRFGIPNENDFGLYMALAEVAADCSQPGELWATARDITAALDQRAADPMLLLPAAVARHQFATRPHAQAVDSFLAAIGQVAYDLSVTNLGHLDQPVAVGGLHLEHVFGAVIGPDAEKVVAVCQYRGRITLTITFNAQVTMDEGTARRLVEAALVRLKTT